MSRIMRKGRFSTRTPCSGPDYNAGRVVIGVEERKDEWGTLRITVDSGAVDTVGPKGENQDVQ